MSPLKHSNNLAARMGRWSANHWKTAVFGWLAFIVASVFIGGAVGTKYLEDNDLAVGEAGRATKIIDAGFPQSADEQGEIVLIQSKTLKATDPAFKAAIEDVTKTLDAMPKVRKLDSPLEAGHADLISADGHSAMVQFSPQGTYEEAILYIETIEAAVDKTAARHPGFEIDELGSASTGKAVDEAFNSMLKTAGMVALPLTLVILLIVFGSAVAALIPLLLAITAVMATTALIALPSQFIPVDESIAEVILLIGLAVGIDYSLFYLRREREERAAGRSEHAALEAAAATSGRAVLDLGRHRADRDGRHVPLRRQDVHVLLDRDDDGRRDRDDRLAHRAPGAPRPAGRQGREGSHPVRAPAPPQGRRQPLLGRDPDPRPPAPGLLGRRRRCGAHRADDPGVLAEHRYDRARRHLDSRDRADEEVRRAFPGGNDPGRRRDQGR